MFTDTYEDDQVACDEDELVVKHYYFPVGGKHIPYASIRGVSRLEELTGANSVRRWRIWGSGDFVHWWNFDPRRPTKTAALVLDIGKRVRPTITPGDPDTVERILSEHARH